MSGFASLFGAGSPVGIRVRVIGPFGVGGLGGVIPAGILSMLGVGDSSDVSVQIPGPTAATGQDVPKAVSELIEVAKNLHRLGGIYALHADRLYSSVKGKSVSSQEEVRESVNIKDLLTELSAVATLIESQKQEHPTSAYVFNDVEKLVTDALAAWTAISESKPETDAIGESLTIDLSGTRGDVEGLKTRILALIEEENLRTVIAAGKKYGAAFRLSPDGHLITIIGTQVQVNQFSYTREELTTKVTDAGVELEDLKSEDLPKGMFDQLVDDLCGEGSFNDIMSSLPSGIGELVGDIFGSHGLRRRNERTAGSSAT